MFAPIFTAKTYRQSLAGVAILASCLCAISLVAWGASPFAHYLQHGQAASLTADALFVLGWLMMCGAMMLPTALPLLAAVERLTKNLARNRLLVFASAAGFLAVWLAGGVLVRWGDAQLHALTMTTPWLAARESQIGAVLLGIGGAYLLSPIAMKCASACQSPMGFIARAWAGPSNALRQTFRIGMEYGLSCFGCCWPLMAVMCALGMANLIWMLGFTLIMLAQKNSRFGWVITASSGTLMLVLAALIAASGTVAPAHVMSPGH